MGNDWGLSNGDEVGNIRERENEYQSTFKIKSNKNNTKRATKPNPMHARSDTRVISMRHPARILGGVDHAWCMPGSEKMAWQKKKKKKK
jgi:hypothetical protein